jgi:hypothetical protein
MPDLATSHFRSLEPTDAIKNYTQARDLMRKQGLTDDQINQVMPPETLAMGNSADPGYRDYVVARSRALESGQPLPPELQTYADYQADKAAKAKLSTEKAQDVAEARTALPGYNSSLDDMENRVGRIAANSQVLSGILSDPAKKVAATRIINAGPDSIAGTMSQYLGVLTQPEINALDEIRQLHLQNYSANFKSGQRLTQTEATRLGAAADQLSNVELSPENYMKQLQLLQNKIKKARANNYGAAQDFNNLPVELRPRLDPSYLSGGVNAPKDATLPAWAKPIDIETPEDFTKVPYGQAYRPKSGKYAGRILYKGLENQFED